MLEQIIYQLVICKIWFYILCSPCLGQRQYKAELKGDAYVPQVIV